jgi:hypothetical protein
MIKVITAIGGTLVTLFEVNHFFELVKNYNTLIATGQWSETKILSEMAGSLVVTAITIFLCRHILVSKEQK